MWIFKVGLFKKWKQEQGRSKKQLRAKEENYDDEDGEEEEEEEDDDEEGDSEDDEEGEDEDEDYNEVDDSNIIKRKTLNVMNPKILGTRKDEGDVDDTEEEEEEKEGDEDDEDDYPEGVTEYDPPDSLHSCTDITMTDRLLERWTYKFFFFISWDPLFTGQTQLRKHAQDCAMRLALRGSFLTG